MEQNEEIRLAHQEDKRSKHAIAEAQVCQLMEKLYGTLVRKNQFSALRMPEWAVALQLQSLKTACDLAALIDVLERMGKIERTELMAHGINRLSSMIDSIEKPN